MKTTKIFFDARLVRVGTHFGVSRYCAELAAAFAKLHPITLIIQDEKQLTMLPKGLDYVKLNNPMSLSELWISRKLNRLGADVVFTPLQLMGWWGKRYKLIVTMHDTFYYEHRTPPRGLPWWVSLGWRALYLAYWPQRWILNRSDFVATVSETSKKDIQKYHLTDRPIGIIYDAPNKPPGIARAKNIKKELVYVSSFMKYKNHETLVQVANMLPEYTMHFTSPVWPERKAELLELADNPRQITFWNGASDQQMYKLLSTATAAVHSSKAEGFGLPLIEAMSIGTPAICSDIPIFHEVAGDAAIFCNPNKPEEYVAAIRHVEDPKISAKYAKKGIDQAKKFNWDVSAKQLLAIITRLDGD